MWMSLPFAIFNSSVLLSSVEAKSLNYKDGLGYKSSVCGMTSAISSDDLKTNLEAGFQTRFVSFNIWIRISSGFVPTDFGNL